MSRSLGGAVGRGGSGSVAVDDCGGGGGGSIGWFGGEIIGSELRESVFLGNGEGFIRGLGFLVMTVNYGIIFYGHSHSLVKCHNFSH